MTRSTSGGNRSSKATALQQFAHHADAAVANAANDALQALPAGYAPDEPIQQLLDKLFEKRSTVPDKGPELSQLDRAIIPSTELVCKTFAVVPYNISNTNEPTPPSTKSARAATSTACILVQDVSEAKLLVEASALMEVQHLSDAAGPAAWPVRGIVFGPYKRPLVCLPTSMGTGAFKNIIYKVDMGAAFTRLSAQAFNALGAEAAPAAAHVNLNGLRCHVHRCAQDSSHADIPVLGTDYMSRLQLSLHVDYKAETVTLDVAH